MLSEEIRYELLKLLEANPELSQRAVARALGISLGRVNYCVNALIEKGLVKASNFRNSRSKRMYVYLLTPKGLEEKANVTARFLRRKLEERKALTAQIEQLRREAKFLLRQDTGNRGTGR